MKFLEFVKKELTGWKKYEIFGLVFVLFIVVVNAFFTKDSIVAVISAICGIFYTIIAGKGKISCYLFGLTGSGCYSYLAFHNALYGNLVLYLCYYIPMQILGIFKWKDHLKTDSKEIEKICLPQAVRIKLFLVSLIGSFFMVTILYKLNDSHPFADGITTFLSIIGMYLTVKRAIEQWFVWMIVNGLSFIMWLNLIIHGAKVFSTLIMWGVYFILAIYFYKMWKKEIAQNA